MEATEKGLLRSDLKFGRADNLEAALEDIAHRRGLGEEMAEGSMRMAEKHGGEDFCIHSKGLEMPGYEPRRAIGQGLGYATANRGGCHLNSGYLVFFEATGASQIDPLTKRGKPALNVLQQNLFDAISSSGSCIFTAYAVIPSGLEEKVPPYGKTSAAMAAVIASSGLLLSQQASLPLGLLKLNIPLVPYPMAIGAAMGIDYTLGDFIMAGERVYNLERMFNLREGFSKEDDSLPGRIIHEPQDPENPATKVPLDDLLPPYYHTRGWDEDGVPKESMLKKLGLEDLLDLRREIKGGIETATTRRKKLRKEQDAISKELLARRGGKK
jgi:aldehyde:ferredoxin oxidoreductase